MNAGMNNDVRILLNIKIKKKYLEKDEDMAGKGQKANEKRSTKKD